MAETSRKDNEKGIALIITLLITALLTAVCIEVIYASYLNTSMTELYSDGQEAALAAEGGVELAYVAITELKLRTGHVYFEDNEHTEFVSDGDASLSLAIEDELGKVPINMIVGPNGMKNQWYYGIYERLLESLELDPALAETLADWLDTDEVPRPMGAETNDYYSRLSEPYKSKGSRLESIEELLLVSGYTLDVFVKLRPFISINSFGPININTASKEVLASLSVDIDEALAEAVIERRKEAYFESTGLVDGRTGLR